MSLTSLALKIAAPIPDIEKYDSFLFIGPHPDDIEIGAGATVAKLVAAGKRVGFLTCIDGRFGDCNAPVQGDELAELRRQEGRRSAEYLGVDSLHYLNFTDAGFYDFKELETEIARYVGSFKPQVIFAPDHFVSSECHIDHVNVGLAAAHVAHNAPYPRLMARYGAESAPVEAIAFYMTAKPNRFIKTSRELVNKQLHSVFGVHLSQFPEGCGDAKSISLYTQIRSLDFGLRSLKGRAEGFRVLGRVHMHCLPEAGK